MKSILRFVELASGKYWHDHRQDMAVLQPAAYSQKVRCHFFIGKNAPERLIFYWMEHACMHVYVLEEFNKQRKQSQNK